MLQTTDFAKLNVVYIFPMPIYARQYICHNCIYHYIFFRFIHGGHAELN